MVRSRRAALALVAGSVLVGAPVALADGGYGDGKDGKDGKDDGKTTICHATGSATNPFVLITVANEALAAHRRHQEGEDIIPAPTRKGKPFCPKKKH